MICVASVPTPWSRRDIQCSGKVLRGYTPSKGGLHTDFGLPKPGWAGGIVGGKVGGNEVRSW